MKIPSQSVGPLALLVSIPTIWLQWLLSTSFLDGVGEGIQTMMVQSKTWEFFFVCWKWEVIMNVLILSTWRSVYAGRELLEAEHRGLARRKPISMKTKSLAEKENANKYWCIVEKLFYHLVNPSFGAEEKLSELFFEVSFVGDEVFKGGIFRLELVNIIPALNCQTTA